MAKKNVGVSLRKPPPPVDVDSFVAAAASDEDKTPASGMHALARVETREVVTSSTTGRAFREITLYVPQELAQKLGVHCAENDRDMSNVVAEAVAKILEPPPPPPAVIEAEPLVHDVESKWPKPLARFEGTIKLIRARLAGR